MSFCMEKESVLALCHPRRSAQRLIYEDFLVGIRYM